MIEFVREMNKSYVKISEEDSEENDSINNFISGSYCMKMIENNDIEQFIRARGVHINDSYSWMYDISGMNSLEDSFDKSVFSYEQLMYIISFFKSLFSVCDRYMLDMDGIILNIKYIFCNSKNGHWKLIYNTAQKKTFREQIKNLFEYILSRLDHKEQQTVVMAYGIYKCICDETQEVETIFEDIDCENRVRNEDYENNYNDNYRENYRENGGNIFGDSKTVIVEKKSLNNEEIIPESFYEQKEVGVYEQLFTVRARMVAGSAAAVIIVASILYGKYVITVASAAIIAGYYLAGHFLKDRTRIQNVNKKSVYHDERCIFRKKEKIEISDGNKNDSFVSMEIRDDRKPETERTMLLNNQPKLVITTSSGSRREVMLYDDQVIIGSGEDADIRINEQGVSRNHAKLSKEGDFYFIKDMNSTNGTRVNDHLLNVYELCRVMLGDKIYIAGCTIELIDMVF